MVRSPAVLLVLAAACGRWHFDAQGTDPDAGSADGSTADAPGTGCNPTAPFGPPEPIVSLNTIALDGTLRLAPDELSGYFWSSRSGTSRIYQAQRAALDQPFTVTLVNGLDTTGNDLDPVLATDGSILVFRHNMPGDELWIATRVDAITFTNRMAIANLNTASVEAQPYLQEGGDRLVFQSNRLQSEFALYESTRNGTTFSSPTRINELDSANEEGDPVLSADGLTLFFRSDRPGGAGAFDIYVATRPTLGSPFGAATLVPNVSSAADDGPSYVSTNGCRLYLSSDRTGDNDIYVATRGM